MLYNVKVCKTNRKNTARQKFYSTLCFAFNFTGRHDDSLGVTETVNQPWPRFTSKRCPSFLIHWFASETSWILSRNRFAELCWLKHKVVTTGQNKVSQITCTTNLSVSACCLLWLIIWNTGERCEYLVSMFCGINFLFHEFYWRCFAIMKMYKVFEFQRSSKYLMTSIAHHWNETFNACLTYSRVVSHTVTCYEKCVDCVNYYEKKTWGVEMAVPFSQGMLRITSSLMQELFSPTLVAISDHVISHLNERVSLLFLVGGFAESQMLQNAVHDAVSQRVRVIIPSDASLTILKGAVLFGLDPTAVRMRTSHMTYGVGELVWTGGVSSAVHATAFWIISVPRVLLKSVSLKKTSNFLFLMTEASGVWLHFV